MSLASLPHRIPFNLGGLVRPAEVRGYGLTGVLPKRLPFTLSAIVPVAEVPYGTLGWELICRAHDDFQTELLRTTDFTSLTFSKELSAFGAASFTLNLDHPLFKSTLSNGSSIEELFDYENLWEIRFDGKIRFQLLGTAVVDSHVNESEMRTATVSGSGTAKVLEWASVYPNGFPDNITQKLETLVDPFAGDTLNTQIWKNTGYRTGIYLTEMGAKQEASKQLEDYQEKAIGINADLTAANTAYDIQRIAYAVIMKNPSSTKAQKVAATKALNDAKSVVQRASIVKYLNDERIAWALATKTFANGIVSDETFGHVKLALSKEGSIYIRSGEYDFQSSGISAGFDVAPSASGSTGQVNTVFKISYAGSSSNFARMYTTRISGNLRMVAEVSNNFSVAVEDWEFDQPQQKYWRIREDNGEVVFDTSPDNAVWTEKYRSAYTWPASPVVAQFGIDLEGNVGISLPIAAYMYKLNESVIPAVDPVMSLFQQLLALAQARGTIPYVTTTYTDSVDSRGLAWVGQPVVDVKEGTKLSIALQNLCDIQQADWIMEPDFKINVYQRTKEDITIPPVFFRKEDVVFHEAGSQVTKERTRSRDEIANAIVGKNAAGSYAYIEDTTSISDFQRREAFIEAGNAEDLENLALILDSSLETLKNEKSSWKVVVAADQLGRRVFEDYNVGDWISIENIDSRQNISIGEWRVIGIAVQVVSDAQTTVELTLQSRMEILAVRLKAQLDNLSTSSVSGGATVGGAISAATLIQQATLAGLKDVIIPNPVEGDVLTYSEGFWVPAAPGDKTIPNPPAFVSVYSNVYYPADGVSVRAQAQLTWTLPTNTDGSVISDGHHYEVRYRPDVSADYPATWEEAAQGYWEDLFTWGQPTIPPITNSGWQTIYVGWDELSTVIQELSPGVDYQVQIRAVDSSTPQHFSEWSATYDFSATKDTIAPATPAPPIVASSMLGIQVQHFLGMAPSGTFDLPPDMAYLEVHVGGPAFYPDDSTRVGKIMVDAGLILSGTPAVQSFPVEITTDIWVRVVAVDKAGNKSSPSSAVTSTINLIDDAHVSDLTASKITAGTISSSIILAGVIKTAESGARAEMNYEGFRIFSEDDDATVSLLGSPGTNGNFLLIKDLEDPTQTLAGIDGTGRGSFQSVTVSDDITIQGELLLQDVINPRARGVISIGYYPDDPIVGGGVGAANERGFLEISFIAEESRTYMICAVTEWESTVADDAFVMRLRDFGEAEPYISTTWIQQAIIQGANNIAGNRAAQIIYSGTFTPGLHRILWSFYGGSGVATVNPPGLSGGPENTTLIWVEDVGLPKTDTVIVNDGGVAEYNAPPPTEADNNVSKPPKPKPKVEYTKTYSCTWSGTYRSNGDYSSSHGATMVQGDSGSDSWLNDARSLCGFNYTQIMKDTKGATIKACYVTLYANHWFWNDGGTARIGTHNYTGRPGSWTGSRVDEQRVSSSNWPKPGKRKVSLGTTIGNDFKSGTAKGIALGPTTGNKTQYGKFNGNGQANEPVLTIVYVK